MSEKVGVGISSRPLVTLVAMIHRRPQDFCCEGIARPFGASLRYFAYTGSVCFVSF